VCTMQAPVRALASWYGLAVAGTGVAGETDVTVLFKAAPGSRRWQHGTSPGGADDSGYTVILAPTATAASRSSAMAKPAPRCAAGYQ